MSVEIDTSEVEKNLNALAKRFGDAKVRAAKEVAQLVRGEAIKQIQTISPGRKVMRSREGGGTYEHIAAAAGEAPNTDTGRLVSSIQVEVKTGNIFVGSSLDYAGDLEFGTGGMGARPWLNPAVEAKREEAVKKFQIEVSKVTK